MKKLAVFVAILMALVFSGCATSNQSLQTKQEIRLDRHIKFSDKRLYSWLKVDFINYVKRKDDLIEFQANFTNTSSLNKLVSYKIEWKDENGFIQKTIMSKWTKTLVESGRTLNISGISPSVKSADFTIILQEPTKDDKKREDAYHKQYAH